MTQSLLDEGDNSLPQFDPNKNYRDELVGEGKKFKTDEDMARGKAESDIYIKVLERRLDQLSSDYQKTRDENMAGAKLQDLIDQIERKQQQLPNSDINLNANGNKQEPVIDPKVVENLVSSKIQEYELAKRQQENYNIVQNKLKEQYGNNYRSVIKEQIETLGLSDDDINALARKSPAAFFKTLGLDKPEQRETFQAPPRSDKRSDNFAPTGAAKRTWTYYQKLRKENPRLYRDPKTAVQMHEDYKQLGKDFEDGDFHAI